MPGFEHGLNRAVQGFFSGLVVGIALKLFSNVGLIDEHLVTALIILLGLASVLDLMSRMKYWSTAYILGFITGYFMVAYIFGIDVSIVIVILFAMCIVAGRMFKEL
ncbi:hypothetical protein J4526_07640 [Desulfurococcaceae archaeon MEX13E-LK6-19]|nr:hypothetical protein J4526_07640 [Desulfurococcaceae archaeon MEX13E-LK6-19]